MLCEYRLYISIKGYDRQRSQKILEILTAEGKSQLYLYNPTSKQFEKIYEIKIKQNDYKFVYKDVGYRFCCSIGVAHIVVD
ncbi:hypothetical protein GETHED_26010 [Geothrix edaphica]|uniref:Uncharacterized protein n=2 Tax=Geothrix edaphica TaxID=2927976 RepID=A0ABQ5Q0T6_9BACT|nr:hypothetical protein GETHED_26010 [Geothrix edaphica]